MPEEIYIDDLLHAMIQKGASDLHLTVGVPPVFRISGDLVRQGERNFGPKELKTLIYSIMDEQQIRRFENEKELDFAYSVSGLGRFRVNVFYQRDSHAAVLRAIASEIKTVEQLGIPSITKELALLPRGLFLVTGPTGSGKSTTLAALIDYINQNRKCHIITIEDPIEYLHKHKGCVVNQREVGSDTFGFLEALKRVLRQDPDVILLGEMRDLETISTAITAAETGHMVFATLHTIDAAQTIDRIIDVFPPVQQEQIRLQLSNAIQGVLCQTLAKKVTGGRVPAVELMIGTNAIRALIREGKTHQIHTTIQMSGKQGMITMDQSLKDLYKKNIISKEEALSLCSNPSEFRQFITE
ncbi:MAG: type IV pilus twitching motility protein PilT [bacterium]